MSDEIGGSREVDGMRAPDFFIIGAQKAATTALLRVLGGHPEVWMPEQENHFFRDPIYDASAIEAFMLSFRGHNETRLGVKCPDYLGSPEVPGRIVEHLGHADLVVCLRNPSSRAISAYYWYVRWGVLPLAEVNVGLQRLLDGEYDSMPLARQILDYGLYAKHLATYLQHFPQEGIHVIFHEDLKSDFDTSINRLLRFLNLTPVVNVEGSTPNTGVYSIPRLWLLRQRNRRIAQWHPSGKHIDLPRPHRWPTRLVSNGVAGFDRYVLGSIFDNSPPRLDAGLATRLCEFYASDIEKLEILLNRNLESWKQAP